MFKSIITKQMIIKILVRVYILFQKPKEINNSFPPIYPLSAAKLHPSHLHQQHLLPCTTYTIIANHKQIG